MRLGETIAQHLDAREKDLGREALPTHAGG